MTRSQERVQTRKFPVDQQTSTIELEANRQALPKSSKLSQLSWEEIASRARMEADGNAGEVIVADLMSDTVRWRNVLTDMIEEGEDKLHALRRLKGPQRNQIIRDFEGEMELLFCLLYTSPSPRD